MLRARNFVEINLENLEAEKIRLESLYAEIVGLASAAKQQLVSEFLEIIEDDNDNIQARISACNIISSRGKEFGIQGSRTVTDRLYNILTNEFLTFKSSGFMHLKKESHLRELGDIRFCFLEALMVALVRIDFVKMHEHVENIAAKVENPERKDKLIRLLNKNGLWIN